MASPDGFVKILQVILVESHFKRLPDLIQDEKAKVDFTLDLAPSVDSSTNRIVTEVVLNMKSVRETVAQIELSIRMAGIFEFTKLSDEEQQNFSKINAPAIVFPFVREHLMSLTQKAGLNPIIINPINFVELSKRSETKQEAM
ncbi:MAG: protein-export chaperone SecB [Bacteroidota bacterium]